MKSDDSFIYFLRQRVKHLLRVSVKPLFIMRSGKFVYILGYTHVTKFGFTPEIRFKKVKRKVRKVLTLLCSLLKGQEFGQMRKLPLHDTPQ